MYWMYVVMIIIFENGHSALSADTSYMKRSIVDYFSDTRHSYVNKKFKDRAMLFVRDEFKRFGLNVTQQNNTDYRNIIGIHQGTNFGTQHDKIIFVTANYDTESTTKGVDHNGSGVAALLEVARQLRSKKEKLKHTVIFLSSDGHYGELNFFAKWLPEWLDTNYTNKFQVKPYGIVILDTIMNFNNTKFSQKAPNLQFKDMFPRAYDSLSSDDYKGDFIALIYRDSNGGALARTFHNVWTEDSRKQFQIEHFPIPLLAAYLLHSDEVELSATNAAFNAELPTIVLSDTAKLRGRMEVCYQMPCDDLQNMITDDNIAFLGKTADVVTSTVVMLSTDNADINPDDADINPNALKCGGTTVNIYGPMIASMFIVALMNIFGMH